MEDKYIVYRDKEKSLIILVLEGLLLMFCIVVLINPHIMGITERYTPGVWRIMWGIVGMCVLGAFIRRIKLLIENNEYLILDSEGIKQIEYDLEKIPWNKIVKMEEKFSTFGLEIEVHYIKDDKKYPYCITLADVKGDAERIVRIVKAYWKKYR